MLLKVVDRDSLLDYLMALGFMKSAGYELILNSTGMKTAVMAGDQTINLVAQSFSFRLDSNAELALRITDLSLFKKMIKLVSEDKPDISYDENLNTLSYGEHILTLNTKEFPRGHYKSTNGVEEKDHYLARIPDNNILCDVLSSSKLGETLEIYSNRFVMGSWHMDVDIADSTGARLSPNFLLKTYRTAMRGVSRVHKKIGVEDLFLRIFKDGTPIFLAHDAKSSYRAYCTTETGTEIKY